MKILCYGDSNTWGYVPNIDGYSKTATAMQYRERDCWWFALRKNNELFMDGLCGRCIAHENRWNEGRNAMKTIEGDLQKYDNLDLVVVFLGTNDCKSEYADTPDKIAQNLENLLQIIKSKTNAKIAIISPPIVREGTKITDKFYVGGQKKSEKLTDHYKDLASKNGYYFVSGADLEIGEDGEHLTKCGHKELSHRVEGILNFISNSSGRDLECC